MNPVNIYAINLNLSGHSDESISKRKSENIRTIFQNLQNEKGVKMSLGTVKMESYRPKTHKSSYKNYVHDYILNQAEAPCVIVFQSAFDIAERKDTIYRRLYNYLKMEKVIAIYFSNYSLKESAESYMELLQQSLYVPDETPGALRNDRYSNEVISLVKKLRKEPHLISLKSISEATDIPIGSIKTILYWNSSSDYKSGRELTEAERNQIQEKIRQIRISEGIDSSCIETYKETYIP